ncbi:hypothetical protein PAFU01_08750 [Pantoea ananatis]|nr:hypothetical protein PAFU01_08750 [Pantoea ananatis]
MPAREKAGREKIRLITRITSAHVLDMWKTTRVKARQLSDGRDAVSASSFFSAENAAAFYTFCA